MGVACDINEAISHRPTTGVSEQRPIAKTSRIQVRLQDPFKLRFLRPSPSFRVSEQCANIPPRAPARTKLRSKTTPNPSPPTQPFRKGPWIVGGLAIYSFTAYGVYLYRTYTREVEASRQLDVPENVLDRYDRTAKGYDDDVDFAEKIMLLGRLRKRLTRKAYGDVLEVSVGTGRNMEYYDLRKCKSITMLDQSAEMVKIAREKFRGLLVYFFSITLPEARH